MASKTVPETPYYTLAEGQPLGKNDTSTQIRTGSGGGFVLLTSTQLIENLAHFARERIPERSVHAKAAGARGYFEVTDDISDLTDADFLTGIGKKTETLVRISTVAPERGSADTVRDFRGFATKFKTAQGNQDFVFNNQPVFFVRDPTKFPSLNRSHKRDPRTNMASSDMFWDFHVNNQESIHALMFLFGDRGLPSSARHVNAYSGNTYMFTKSDGSYCYVRIHFLTNQGVHYFTDEEGAKLAGSEPDKHLADLQDSIEAGNFPSWDMYVQAIRPEEIADAPVDIFDMTKTWPLARYPRRKVGRLVLDKNPSNWFAEVEQAAFSPSNMVPGIAPSPDPMLQVRMFAYPDAARYRLGVNYQFLPTNAPASGACCPIERDGLMNFTPNYGGDPNYVGTRLKPVKFLRGGNRSGQDGVADGDGDGEEHSKGSERRLDRALPGSGVPVVFSSEVTDKDFEQSTALWHVMGTQEGAQQRLVGNLSAHISAAQTQWIRDDVYAMFARVDGRLGELLKSTTEAAVMAKLGENLRAIEGH
ncbi:catalase [Daldinia caldariorum]|uniref:catalase n=1 Tax=Daldinia caldariorum TaxID=326644 RepID=UPI0020089BAD|nr:catalase [Daldinia caldariorum]KAI1470113.1 catalase [Daldinia caldariorum]